VTPKFRDLLKSVDQNSEPYQIIVTPDFSSVVINAILDLLYYGETSNLKCSQEREIWSAFFNLQLFQVDRDLVESGFGQDLLNADIQLDGDRVFDDVETGSILGRIDPDVLELPRFNITPTKDVGCQATEKEIKRYTNAEIQQACIMYYGGKSTYNYIRNQNLMKLPSKTTIAERTGHYQCQPGFQKDILKLLIFSWTAVELSVRYILAD